MNNSIITVGKIFAALNAESNGLTDGDSMFNDHYSADLFEGENDNGATYKMFILRVPTPIASELKKEFKVTLVTMDSGEVKVIWENDGFENVEEVLTIVSK